MNPSLQEAIKEAYAIAPASVAIVHTLEVRQPGVQDTVYIAQTRQQLLAYDEDGIQRTFEPVGFQFALPPVTEDGFQTLNIAIDNVGRRVVQFIETALSSEVPVEVVYRPYLSTDLTSPQMIPPLVLYVRDVSISPTQVSCTCTFMDLVNKKFPSELYTRERFPTLG